MSSSPECSLYFPPFHLTPDVDVLYRNNKVVPLERRAVRVLRYLVEHRDRVVSKEELLEHVWPDVFTTDSVLKRSVSLVRRALGDQGASARFIETHHGTGYRFIARVAAEQTAAPDLAPAAAARQTDPDYDQLVGREAELEALRAEYRRMLKGEGCPMLIVGDTGIGKTQLARHFMTWTKAQQACVVYGRFFDYQGSRLGPYEVFLDLLRAALGVAKIDTRPPRDSSHTTDFCRMVLERCGVRLPAELCAEAEDTKGPLQPRAGAGNSQRAVGPISKCFVQLSREQPLVMVLDDLQWADEVSRDVAGYLMRTAHHERLMLVALVRKEETVDPAQPLVEWLKRQANYRSYTTLDLKPLDERGCRVAIEAAFGAGHPHIPPVDLQTIVRVTGGNPYFLTEMLRLLVAEGAITFDPARQPRWHWNGIQNLRLPDTLVNAAHAKLDRLSTEVRELAEQAAVIGDEFRVATLACLAAQGEADVQDLLRKAVCRGILSERELSAGEDCRFYHTILRRVLYESLPPPRQRELHAQTARALEAVYACEADRVARAISVHYEAARDHHQTFEWSKRAWQAAKRRWYWSEAVENLERARRATREMEHSGESSLSPADRLILLFGLGEGYNNVGRLKESESVLKAAVLVARANREQAALAAALLQQGQTLMGLSRYPEAISATEEALAIYRRSNDREGAAVALLQLGTIQAALGNCEAVTLLIEEVLGCAGIDSSSTASAFALLGWTRALQCRYAEAAPLLESALDYYTSAGDVRRQAQILRRLHWVQLSRGEYEQAVQLAVRSRDSFRRAGDAGGEAKLNMAIGQARIAQGLYDEGIAFLNRTLESLKTIGDTHCEGETLWLLGRAHGEMGCHDQALGLLARALETIRAVGDRDDEFRILTDLARVQIDMGDSAGLRTADEAISIAEELRNSDGLGAALVERARACLGLHQQLQAQKAAEDAVELLRATGSGDRWRAYWALGRVLASPGKERSSCALQALRSSVGLLDGVREQIDAGDIVRRTAITQARRGPARDLHALLQRLKLASEAEIVASQWQINHA